MKPYLLYKEYTDSMNRPSQKDDLVQDLNLQVIFKVMADNNDFLYNTAKEVILDSLYGVDIITYRQNILSDCISTPKLIHKIFKIASESISKAAYYKEYTKPHYAKVIPVSVKVISAIGLLELLTEKLKELKLLICSNEKNFVSEGMNAFYKMITNSLTDKFFSEVEDHVNELKFVSEKGKIVLGVKLGNGLKCTDIILRELPIKKQENSFKLDLKVFSNKNQIRLDSISTTNSAQEIKEAALVHILRIVNCFTDDTIKFFEMLKFEIGFYKGCINLYKNLENMGAVITFPIVKETKQQNLEFRGLYDMSLAILDNKKPVCNNLDANDKTLLIVTGANQGGKSTFLRSIGLSQILSQCGLFVPADYFCSNICDNVFTHFAREEDEDMNSGKLDEELLRMNDIINIISSDSMLLMNEPFATTTERDGLNIAKDIITALYESNIKVIFVTHLYEFSKYIYDQELQKSIFLRAERNNEGKRSFNIKMGAPLQTSYALDLFNEMEW